MRIIQLVMSRQFRGAEVFSAQLSKELVAGGQQVMYISLYVNKGKEFIPEGIEYKDLMVTQSGAVNVTVIKRLYRFFKTFQPDVVQANAGDTLKYAVLVKKLFGFTYTIVFRNASMVSQYLKSAPQKLFTSWLYRNTDYIISVSESSRQDLVKMFPFCESKSEVIPIGISPKPFQRLNTFSNEYIHLVHVGGFTFEKNHTGLIRIFSSVKKNIPNAKLWLVGDGPLWEKVKSQVHESGLAHDVIFTGAVPNTLDYIASANALLLPSHIEGLPGVVLEAFYCRTPVIANRVGGISELVKPGVTGWLIRKDDEVTFAEAIRSVLLTGDSHEKMKEAAYQLVMKDFDNRVIAKRFMGVYQKLKHH